MSASEYSDTPQPPQAQEKKQKTKNKCKHILGEEGKKCTECGVEVAKCEYCEGIYLFASKQNRYCFKQHHGDRCQKFKLEFKMDLDHIVEDDGKQKAELFLKACNYQSFLDVENTWKELDSDTKQKIRDGKEAKGCLHKCSRDGKLRILFFLLHECEIFPSEANEEGKTALVEACLELQWGSVKAIVDYYNKAQKKMSWCEEQVEQFEKEKLRSTKIEDEMKSNSATFFKDTFILHKSVITNKLENVKYLLQDCEIFPCFENKNGDTAFDVAINELKEEAVAYFVAYFNKLKTTNKTSDSWNVGQSEKHRFESEMTFAKEREEKLKEKLMKAYVLDDAFESIRKEKGLESIEDVCPKNKRKEVGKLVSSWFKENIRGYRKLKYLNRNKDKVIIYYNQDQSFAIVRRVYEYYLGKKSLSQ